MNLSPAGMPADIGSESSSWASFALAGLVHVGLLVFLWIGVQWQSQTPMAVEAEVWDMTAREAAPLAVAPVIESAPAPIEKVKVQPKVEQPPPVEDPDVVLERQKIERLKKKKLEELELAKHEAKLAQELADKQKADKLAKEELEKKKAKDVKEVKDTKSQKKEQSLADQMYADRMRKLTGEASSAVGSGGVGAAPKSTGARGDGGYAARIAGIIRSNTSSAVADNSSKNLTVTYRIYLLPDGSLRGAPQKMQSSGNPRFDEDVEKGIRASAPFPKNTAGKLDDWMDIPYSLKETKQ